MASWVIKDDAGRWSVEHGRTVRPFGTEDEALRYVRDQQAPGDKVVLEESDGYRIPLKRPRHWRK